MNDGIWKDLWVSGLVRESELRALRKRNDHEAARRLLANDTRLIAENVSTAWGGAPFGCHDPETLPARLRRAMSGSYLTTVGSSTPLRLPNVAIVGTRAVPVRTAERLAELVDAIVRSSCGVVSGGAYGVDTLCQDSAIRYGTPMTVVIAGGVLHPSPSGNVEGFKKVVGSGGVVVSDRGPTRTPHRRDFVRRNSLIAALADAVVVAAAPERSGALETARVARKLGVPVLAVPGMFDDPTFAGCHQLLRDGARVCTQPSDVADAMGVQPPLSLDLGSPQQSPTLSAAAEEVLHYLERGLGLDDAVRAGLTAADAQIAYLELELAGLVNP